MTDAEREALVERMAEALWAAFVGRADDWPTWEELLAQGHQGMHRVNEFRGYARAALAAVRASAVEVADD